MSLGPLMLDLEGVELTPKEREMLQHPLVGGVILFTRNFASLEQLGTLVSSIHAVRSPSLLVAVDHEGGRVQRFRDGFTCLPSASRFGAFYDRDHAKARTLTRMIGWLMAIELRAVNIDFSFAPVLDVSHGVSQIIGDRAYHRDPTIVSELAHAFMQGMHEAGMAATGKHFPGHGAVVADSHTDVPVDDREYNAIYADDIVPFKRLISLGLAAVMPAHVVYPKIDSLPAGYSSVWLKEVLRTRLGFQGMIFSDDLNMAGAGVVGEIFSDRARAARDAGCDMVLVCNNHVGVEQIMDELVVHSDPVAHMRFARMHGRHKISLAELHAQKRWREVVEKIRPYQEDFTLDLKF